MTFDDLAKLELALNQRDKAIGALHALKYAINFRDGAVILGEPGCIQEAAATLEKAIEMADAAIRLEL